MVITKNQLTSGYCERHQSEIKLTNNNDNHTMYLGLFSRCLSGGLSLSVLAGVSVADWVSPSSSCITCPLQSNSLCTTSVAGLLNTPSNKSACLSLLQHNSHKNYHNTKKLTILSHDAQTWRTGTETSVHRRPISDMGIPGPTQIYNIAGEFRLAREAQVSRVYSQALWHMLKWD